MPQRRSSSARVAGGSQRFALVRLLAATLVALAATLGSLATAQGVNDGASPAVPPRVTDLRGDDPAELADRAVRRWLDSANDAVTLRSLASDPEAFCRELPALFAAPPTMGDTQVNYDDRQERTVDPAAVPEGVERRRFTYSASTGDLLQVVEVVVERSDGDEAWRPVSVGFFEPAGTGGRAWLRSAFSAGMFIAFSVLVLLDLVRGGRIRQWLQDGRAVLRDHRGIVTVTLVLLYGIFALGVAAGAALPASCADAVQTILETALADVGATQAVASGNIATAATVIFFQNFIVVTVSVLFGASLLFGLPAYLIAALSFFVQAVPFGLLGGGTADPIGLVLVGILLLLELTAYFLVVAGGGMFLAGILRGGFRAVPEAFRSLALMLPIAGMLLLIGAWYEAIVLLLGS